MFFVSLVTSCLRGGVTYSGYPGDKERVVGG